MSNSQTIETPNFLILILIGFLLEVLFDFKSMGGFGYSLLIKLIYMIMIVLALIIVLHPEEVKRAVKQTKIEDYFKKQFK